MSDLWLDSQIGPYGQNTSAMANSIKSNASNILAGENPNYYCYNFLKIYPQFGGTNFTTNISVIASSNQFYTNETVATDYLITDTTLNIPDGTTVTNVIATTLSKTLSVTANSSNAIVTDSTGIIAGMLITDSTSNIPAGTTILSVSGTTITMSNNATTTSTSLSVTVSINTITMSNNATTTADVDVTVYSMLVPATLLSLYIQLAIVSIMKRRWHKYWSTTVGWFVAHFLALYLQGTANAGSNAAQVIAAAQSRGITASKSVGDVSVSYDLTAIAQDLDSWASWKLTIYGQQLATFGNMLGKGGMVV